MTDPLESEARSGSAPTGADRDSRSEQVDDDKLGGDFPPDEPVAADDYGITPQEQRVPEPLEERVERENPEDELAGEADAVGPLVAPDEGQPPDDEAAAIGTEAGDVPGHDRPVGDVGTDDVTQRGTVLDRSADVAAEDAAVHEQPER